MARPEGGPVDERAADERPADGRPSDGPRALAPIEIIGLHGGQWFGDAAAQALAQADAVLGAARLHEALAERGAAPSGERIDLRDPLSEMLDICQQRRAAGQRVAVLASGDPGFFGIARIMVGRFGADVAIHPAPSSVALAFARARIPWDDASVVSVHGRSLEAAVRELIAASKAAVLVSGSTPPEAVGRALVAVGAPHRHAWVASRLGEPDESVVHTDLAGLAEGSFEPLSVLLLTVDEQPIAPQAVVAWGRPEREFAHRGGMITKSEVRAAALSKLQLHGAAVMWDIGAGSGSVSVEAARLAPGLRVLAVERNPEDCDRIRDNAIGLAVTVVQGCAPECLTELPDPDRVFVGGGGIESLAAAGERLRDGGIVVATFAVMGRALAAVQWLAGRGLRTEMVQIAVSRGQSIGGDGSLRLVAENPVFVVWGEPDDTHRPQEPDVTRGSEGTPSTPRRRWT